MLIFYLEQDDRQNFIQHPSLTGQFATAFINTISGLSKEDQEAAFILICMSSSKKDGILRLMFDPGDRVEVDDVDDCNSYVEMNKLYKSPLDKDLEPLQKKAKHDC